jgi:hypothetical protein
VSIRWERLFADLEGQFEAAGQADLAAEIAERTRIEVAQTSLSDRLRAALATDVDLTVVGVGAVSGQLVRVGADFVVVEAKGSTSVIRVAAVATVRDLGAASRPPAGEVAARISFGMVARELSRDRAPVTIWSRDGITLVGTIDRVGADYLDLAEHALDEPRRADVVRGTRTVAIDAVAVVRAS